MPLITEEYRELNRELHERVPAYGMGDHTWAAYVHRLYLESGSDSILNYGAGKGTLKTALHDLGLSAVSEYDPAIPEISALPEPADIVCCLDVLEHVERESIDAVLDHLSVLARKVIFLDISCKVGGKKLADGRPAHVLVRPPEWWRKRLVKYGKYVELSSSRDSLVALIWKD